MLLWSWHVSATVHPEGLARHKTTIGTQQEHDGANNIVSLGHAGEGCHGNVGINI
jgi:hypothetical protein